MLLFLLLLILAGVGVAVYASENTGTHAVTFLQWHWSALSDWVPVVTAAIVIGVLFLLYMIYSGVVHGVRVGSMRRRVTTRASKENSSTASMTCGPTISGCAKKTPGCAANSAVWIEAWPRWVAARSTCAGPTRSRPPRIRTRLASRWVRRPCPIARARRHPTALVRPLETGCGPFSAATSRLAIDRDAVQVAARR